MRIYITTRLTESYFVIGTLSKDNFKFFYFYDKMFDDNEFLDWWEENKNQLFFTINGNRHLARIIDSINLKTLPCLLEKHGQIVVDLPPRKHETLISYLKEQYNKTSFALFQTDLSKIDYKIKYEERKVELLESSIEDMLHELFFIRDVANKKKKGISLRYELSSKYNVSLINMPTWKMAETVLAKEMMKINEEETKKIIDYRNLKPISFSTSEFRLESDCRLPQTKDVIEKMRNISVKDGSLDGIFKEIVNIKGLNVSVGMGGLHGYTQGTFVSDSDMSLLSFDIKSFYPTIIITNDLEPIQTKGLFHDAYKVLYDIKMNSDDRYKDIINTIYGLSSYQHSYLYDPMFTANVTLVGEIRMLELLEIINDTNAIPIKINTDGFELIIPSNEVDALELKLEGWKTVNGFTLKENKIFKMCIKDNANYFILGRVNDYPNVLRINDSESLSFDIKGDKNMLNKYLFGI